MYQQNFHLNNNYLKSFFINLFKHRLSTRESVVRAKTIQLLGVQNFQVLLLLQGDEERK